jgi:hypothetical protein
MRESLHTDLEILQCIFDMYRPAYPGEMGPEGKHVNDPFVPVVVADIASRLNANANLIFGRLYFHLNKKHGYAQANGGIVYLFTPKVGEKGHCVHFPLLTAVLAGERQEANKHKWTRIIAVAAVAISIVGLMVQVVLRK